MLSLGTIEPCKNLAHVVEAFAQLPTQLRERCPLVISGAMVWHSSSLVAHLRRLTDRQVRFLGPVERATLLHLYAGASLFVFASLYEGFGLPPLEAMASGVPVVISDRASLPEVVGDAGERTDPLDTATTAARIRALLEDDGRRAQLVSAGLARAARFTWTACADSTSAVYKIALRRAGRGARV